jgi:hypothetical protein
MKFTVTYARDIIDVIEARDTDHAARLACAAVFACDPAFHARVLSIIRIDPPPNPTCPDCQPPQLALPPPTTPQAA